MVSSRPPHHAAGAARPRPCAAWAREPASRQPGNKKGRGAVRRTPDLKDHQNPTRCLRGVPVGPYVWPICEPAASAAGLLVQGGRRKRNIHLLAQARDLVLQLQLFPLELAEGDIRRRRLPPCDFQFPFDSAMTLFQFGQMGLHAHGVSFRRCGRQKCDTLKMAIGRPPIRATGYIDLRTPSLSAMRRATVSWCFPHFAPGPFADRDRRAQTGGAMHHEIVTSCSPWRWTA